jgi:hypothetical protein
VVGAPLDRDDVVAVVVAERGGAVQDRDLGLGREDRQGLLHPLVGREPVDGLLPLGQQGPAGGGLLVHQDHPGTGPGRLPGRGEAGGPGPDDEHVGVDVLVVVVGLVLGRVQLTQPAQVRGGQTVGELHRGGRQHGLVDVGGGAGRDLHQRVGLLDAGGHDPARAAEVHRVAAGDPPRGQQGRGQGVPGVAGELLPVDAEADGRAAVEAGSGDALGRKTVGLDAHWAPPRVGWGSPIR